ncbi:hypothetical protein FKM82_030057 [Ascaphus truei]
MTPFFGNRNFPPGTTQTILCETAAKNICRLFDFSHDLKATPFDNLVKDRGVPPREIFRYLQLRAFYGKVRPTISVSLFERPCLGADSHEKADIETIRPIFPASRRPPS